MAKQPNQPNPNQQPSGQQPAASLFSKRLRQMKATWESTKEESKKEGGNFEILLEDGRYTARLSRAEIKDTGEKLGVVMDFVVVDGNPEDIGQNAGRWSGIDDPDKLVYFQRDLRRLGVEVDQMDIEQLPALLSELVAQAPTCRITIKTNKQTGYKNVYIDKLLSYDGGDATAAEHDAAGAPAETTQPAEATEDAGKMADTEPADGEAEETEPANEADTDTEDVQEGEGLEVGNRVSYLNPTSKKKQTGAIETIDPDDGTLDIRDDKSKKLVRGIDPQKVEALAEVVE